MRQLKGHIKAASSSMAVVAQELRRRGAVQNMVIMIILNIIILYFKQIAHTLILSPSTGTRLVLIIPREQCLEI